MSAKTVVQNNIIEETITLRNAQKGPTKYIEHEKSYKNTLDREQVKHRNKVSTYLNEIKTKNPMECWKIINKHTKNKKGH